MPIGWSSEIVENGVSFHKPFAGRQTYGALSGEDCPQAEHP
jgi:hypothetical protein